MKRTGLPIKGVGFFGLVGAGIILAALALTPIIANAKIVENDLEPHVFPAIQQPALPNQEDEFDWAGVWDVTATVTGYSNQGKGTLTIVRNADGSYSVSFTGEAFVLGPIKDKGPRYPKITTNTTSYVEGSAFVIQILQYHYGIHHRLDALGVGDALANVHTGSNVIRLQRTTDPNLIKGDMRGQITHFITGNDDAGWYIVEQPQPLEFTGEYTARRSGGAPAEQAPQPTGSFEISMGCSDRVNIQDHIACTVHIYPDEGLAGTPFSIIWNMDGVFAGEDGGSITSGSVSIPPISPGYHQIQVNVTSISTGKSKSATMITEVVSAEGGAVAPPVAGEAAAPSAGAGAVGPSTNGDGDTTNILPGSNPVSPAGQAAAAAATTTLLAIWLFLEYQNAAQGGREPQPASSSSSDIADIVMQETGFSSEADAGSWLAQNTADLLDSLDGSPPAATQPPSPVKEEPAESSTTTGGKPGSDFNGTVSGITTEVFSDQDAYLIMQALGLVPPDMRPTDHLFEIGRGYLDFLLGNMAGGKPQRVTLPNGNEIIVNEVRGLAFEDAQYDDVSDLSTIDLTSGFSIAVDVVLPGSGATTAGAPGSASAQAGQQTGVQPPGQAPGVGAQASGLPSGGPSSTGGDEAQPLGYEPDEQAASEQTLGEQRGEREAGEPMGGEAVSEGSSQTRPPEEDEAEIDRFFSDEVESDSQGQGAGDGASGGDGDMDLLDELAPAGGLPGRRSGGSGGRSGSRLGFGRGAAGGGLQSQEPGGSVTDSGASEYVDGGEEGGESLLDVGDEGDMGDEGQLVEGEAVTDQGASQGDAELNARIDSLMDEIRAGLKDQSETAHTSGGGEASGSSTAGIIDEDESSSPTEGF